MLANNYILNISFIIIIMNENEHSDMSKRVN